MNSIIDKVINIITIVCLVTIILGTIIAIWVGLIGFRIAGSGAVVLIATYIGYWLINSLRLAKENEKREDG